MNVHRALALLAVTAAVSCSGAASLPNAAAPAARAASRTRALTAGLDVPPRLQWMANFGYCGEVSLISAGLYYGQYASQYQVRAIASPGTPQYTSASQLLLGVNDAAAAAKMHLSAIEWNTKAERTTGEFLAWVARNVSLGRPVAIGVYNNEYLLYGKTNPQAGDALYDHIVPVTSVRNETLTFSDNGLWSPSGSPRYLFTYGFASFQKTRAQANAKNGTVYSLANGGQNYGIAIAGVADADRETVPVRLSTNVNDEIPAMRNGSTVRPKPMPLLLTVAVSNLKPGVSYNLYRYDRFTAVPDSGFNAHASAAAQHWSIRIARGSTYALTQRILSDQVAVYRAVPAAAP
jgi:hypothetical protein